MKAAANKAPGPEGIPNRILHLICDRIMHMLVAIFNTCLRHGMCPEEFKDSMTVVLRKPGKGDYTQVKSYRPIAHAEKYLPRASHYGLAIQRLGQYQAAWQDVGD